MLVVRACVSHRTCVDVVVCACLRARSCVLVVYMRTGARVRMYRAVHA